jgi:hypothetical protein
MKLILVILSVLSSVAWAASPAPPAPIDPCKVHFECGVYSVTTNQSNMKITYTITTATKGPNSAQFHFVMVGALDENLIANFEPVYDPQSKALVYSKITLVDVKGNLFANGLCAGKMCTFGLVPTPDPTDDTNTTGQVGLIRFAAGKMEFALLGGTPIQLTPNMQQTLTKSK